MDTKEEVNFLENIIKNVVDNPNDVKVIHEVDDKGIKLTVSVNRADMGKLIGSQGRMATAVRTLMHAYGGQHDQRISVIIEEPQG